MDNTQSINIYRNYRDHVIAKVLLATYVHPVDARSMWSEWDIKTKHNVSIEGWQRIISKIINEYQTRQYERAEKGEAFHLILSSSNGYYLCHNEGEAVKGLNFYDKRFEPMFARRKLIKNLIKKKYDVNVDHPGQAGQGSLFA